METNEVKLENEKIISMIMPLFKKRQKELMILLVFVNVLLLWLALSKIFFFAKVFVSVTIILLDVFCFFYYRSLYRDFYATFKLPTRRGDVTFSASSMGDSVVYMAELINNGEKSEYMCQLHNVSLFQARMTYPCYIFEKPDRPKLLVSEDMSIFALL